MKPALFHPEASQEYTEAIRYYAAVRSELGQRFDSEIKRVVSEISHEPHRFFRFHPPARRALARKFPYAVVYLDEPERVWIVAVMHAKRRPGYWMDRLG